jgi:hypothetical protein
MSWRGTIKSWLFLRLGEGLGGFIRSYASGKLPGDRAMEEVGTVRPCELARGPKYRTYDADSASESLIQILLSAFESRTAGFRTLPADAPRRFKSSNHKKRQQVSDCGADR